MQEIMPDMIILAIETSCDETSVAILKNKQVVSNVTVSQILQQQKFKGVMPGLAAKLHLNNIQYTLQKAYTDSGISWEQISYIAYTKEPGLVICLQIGKMMAETIALFLEKELVPVNHLKGHILACLLNTDNELLFPALALVISGGHTQLYLLENYNSWQIIGDTKDDTIGECIDKTAVLLGYDYPGGPKIELFAKTGYDTYALTVPKNDKTCDFSFSGLKSQIDRLIKKEQHNLNVNNLACSLQYTLARILIKKIKNAFFWFSLNKKKPINIRSFVVGGGVIANQFLRQRLLQTIHEIDSTVSVFFPHLQYSTDNAAMIGICAYYQKSIPD